MIRFRFRTIAASALVAVACDLAPALPMSAVPPLPRCAVADATLRTRLDSAVNTAGDAFAFTIVDRIDATATIPEIEPGTKGYGVVAFATHANGAGIPGRLVVEPRYLAMPDGSHFPVIADPQLAEAFAEGSSGNAPGALSFVPGIGLAVSGYNALHRGKEVVLDKGMPFRVVLGDELAAAECFVPSPDSLNVR